MGHGTTDNKKHAAAHSKFFIGTVDSRSIRYAEYHENIAKNLGTSREVISRILKYLENDGVIQLSRGRITIIDLKKLKEISN